MKMKNIIVALVAIHLAAGQIALAQGELKFPERGRNDQGQRYDKRDQRDQREQRYQREDRDQRGQRNYNDARERNARDFEYRRDHPQGYGGYQRYSRGAGPDHNFYPGARLPLYYRSYQYVVDDWRGHRLSAPPRGYHWVQTGGDYVLVAIATGIILQLLLDN